MDKAAALPPQDPDGDNTVHPDLTFTKDKIIGMLENCLQVALDWMLEEMKSHHEKCITEGRTLQDNSVEELDENLRRQWPRKGRLEVEVFQERKA